MQRDCRGIAEGLQRDCRGIAEGIAEGLQRDCRGIAEGIAEGLQRDCRGGERGRQPTRFGAPIRHPLSHSPAGGTESGGQKPSTPTELRISARGSSFDKATGGQVAQRSEAYPGTTAPKNPSTPTGLRPCLQNHRIHLLMLHGQSWDEKYDALSDRHDGNPSSDTTWSLGNQRSRPCSTSSEGLIGSIYDFRFMIFES